eukprot:TRINITY_DN9813_c0_g1_i1.p1 TRINITY_DN9813_c0_g1~~TRINITY_DN9813_c0_g1_i1.p1  ORF type:complete len:282 (+),score=27.07 TRINITY_DN9813_c0_g1_i1:115-846(+)
MWKVPRSSLTLYNHYLSDYQMISPSSYGLFARLTTERDEIAFEGCVLNEKDHCDEWIQYRLPFQPSIATDAPPFVIPHMPRLDWQMWFAALSSVEGRGAWTLQVAHRLVSSNASFESIKTLFDDSVDDLTRPDLIRLVRRRYNYANVDSDAYWTIGAAKDFGGQEFTADALEKMIRTPPKKPDSDAKTLPTVRFTRNATRACFFAPWIVALLIVVVFVKKPLSGKSVVSNKKPKQNKKKQKTE